jgi:hypothetical protein
MLSDWMIRAAQSISIPYLDASLGRIVFSMRLPKKRTAFYGLQLLSWEQSKIDAEFACAHDLASLPM